MKKVIVLLAIIWFSGCATTSVVTGPEKQFQDATISVKEKRYKEAAAACNKIMADAPDSPLAADALFEIALINVHFENPKRDYVQASRMFAEFVKRYPDNRRTDEAQAWISVLKTVQELKKQNEHLNESIEELKKLDIRHEEKRKIK
ncbi:MAG: outer membrane protein assembly factor BamD [Nitrospirota bacterium]